MALSQPYTVTEYGVRYNDGRIVSYGTDDEPRIHPWIVVALIFGAFGVAVPWVLPRLLDWWWERGYQRIAAQMETRTTGNEDRETLTP